MATPLTFAHCRSSARGLIARQLSMQAKLVLVLRRIQSNEMTPTRSIKRMVLGALAATFLTPHSSIAGPPSISLVEARLTKVESITGERGAPCFCDDQGRAIIDGSFRLIFLPLRTLAGRAVHHSVSMDQASAEPIPGLRYFLIITHTKSGNAIVWKGLARDGLCLGRSEAERYGLTHGLTDFPCTQR